MLSNKTIFSGALALAGVMAVGLAGCAKQEAAAPPAFATVNGEPITQTEFLTFLERKPTVQVQTPQGDQEVRVSGILGLQALRDLVNRKLLLQLAKDDGVLPTADDVEKEIKFKEEAQPGFVSSLAAEGVSLDLIKSDLIVSLARERLQTKGITVTPAEVDAYIKSNQSQFMDPAKAKLQWIVVSDPKKKDMADKDLKSGQSFASVAVRYSEAPNARQANGAFGEEEVDKMPPRLQQIIAKVAASKESDWVSDGRNFVKFYVVSKSPSKPMEMTPTRKEMLRRNLALEKGSATTDLGKRITEKMQAANVTVNSSELKDPWQKAFEATKQQLAAAMKQQAQAQGTPAPTEAPKR